MDDSLKRVWGMIARYIGLIIIALPNLWIFYKVFTPFTVFPVYFLFSIFFNVSLTGTTLIIESCPFIELISACVAGSAYYLLLILNLSIPNISFKKRIKMILVSFLGFWIINILRIFFLGLVFSSGSSWFDFTHKLFWWLGSVVLIVVIWFLEVKIFKIKGIPFFSDMKFLYGQSNPKKIRARK